MFEINFHLMISYADAVTEMNNSSFSQVETVSMQSIPFSTDSDSVSLTQKVPSSIICHLWLDYLVYSRCPS